MLPLVAALAVPPPDTEDARESTASPRTASYTYQSYMLRRERVLSLAALVDAGGGRGEGPRAQPLGLASRHEPGCSTARRQSGKRLSRILHCF